MNNVVINIIAIVLIILIIWFLLPLTAGIFHIGMIYPSVFFSILLFGLLRYDLVKSLFDSKLKPLCVIVCIGLSALTLLCAVTGGFMINSASNRKAENGATVVVLGCKVRGSTPSRMLYDRMNAALLFLKENPDSKVVASGGKGAGEDISEAQAIHDYLIENGIAEDRIYMEDKSINTYENLKFSSQIIEKENLSKNVAIASDNFHQLRASIFAKDNGLTPYSCGCKTYILVSPSYWTREILGVVKAVVFGH